MKKKHSKLFNFIIILLCTSVVIISGAALNMKYEDNKNSDNTIGSASEENADSTEEKVLTYDEKIEDEAERLLENMTLNEKIGQLFVIEVDKLDSQGNNVVNYKDNMANILNKYNVGGVIYFSENIVSREQVINLNKSLQENSKTKLFISVDEEGGTVSRIANNKAMGTTKFSSMRSIGDTGDENKAYEVGNTIGKEISALGFNLDFAPDADILTTSKNTEIGTRSFGENADIVSKMSSQVVKGLQDNNVSATLKHFPGHGNSESNSHDTYTYTNQTLEQMRNLELIPFKKGIEEGVDFILVSHISVPNVTGNKVPSSLNKTIISDVLRNELGFKNIVITDALNMKAVSDYYEEDKVCIDAINAGADMLLMVPDLDKAYNSVVTACQNGEITEERINESVKRILKIKLKRSVIEFDE